MRYSEDLVGKESCKDQDEKKSIDLSVDLTETSASTSASTESASISIAVSKVHGYNNGGHDLYARGEFAKALRFYHRALKWARTAENFHPAKSSCGGRRCVQSYESKEHQETRKSQELDKHGIDVREIPTSHAGNIIPAALLVPTTLVNIGKTYLCRNNCDKAECLFQEAISHLQSDLLYLPWEHPHVVLMKQMLRDIFPVQQCLSSAMALQARGKDSEILGHYREAMSAYTTTLQILTDMFGPIHPVVAVSLQKIGVMYWKRGRYEKSLSTLSDSLQILVQCLGQGHPDSVETVISIGMVHLSRGDYEAAMEFFQVALETQKIAFGDRHPEVAKILIRIGKVSDEAGKHAQAANLYRKGIGMQRAALAFLEGKTNRVGEDIGSHTIYTSLLLDIAESLNSKGVVDEKCGRFPEAMDSYEEALHIYQRTLGDSHVDIAITLSNIGQIYRHWGQYDMAMGMYQHALRVMEASLGESHRNVAAVILGIGVVYFKKGEYHEGKKLFKKALKIQRKALGEKHPDVGVTLEHIGEVYEARGNAGQGKGSHDNLSYCQEKYQKACHFYKRVLKVRKSAFGSDHYYVALTLTKLALTLAKIGDDDKALKHFQSAMKIFQLNSMSEEDPQVADTSHYLHQLKNRRRQKKSSSSSSSLSAPPSGSSAQKSCGSEATSSTEEALSFSSAEGIT